jgi:hypothetical protein
VLFLMATTPDRGAALLWGLAFTFAGGLAIARGLLALVRPGSARLFAAAWSVVGLGIAGRLFVTLCEAAMRGGRS